MTHSVRVIADSIQKSTSRLSKSDLDIIESVVSSVKEWEIEMSEIDILMASYLILCSEQSEAEVKEKYRQRIVITELDSDLRSLSEDAR